MNPLATLFGSSTFWCPIILAAVKLLGDRAGLNIPWDVVAYGTGAMGLRNAATKIADGHTDAALVSAGKVNAPGEVTP